MTDIYFLITTYNRKESCQRLVDSLQGIGDILVVGDFNDYDITGARYINLTAHLGRAEYWKTINLLFANRERHKYYIMLPDDFLMRDFQIENAIKLWETIADPKKICLNLYSDRVGLACWTRFKPVDLGSVWHTQWVDMCFLCEDKFFTALGFIHNVHASTSSGVGAYISRFFHKRGYGLYQVKESLVIPQEGHCISQMHSADQKPRRHTHHRSQFHIYNTK
jgi:hypothetical protein